MVTPAATNVEPYKEGLVAGRAYTRETLLWSALLASSNDSATALAIDAGGGSLAGFYALANARAKALGMTSTTYASASGLDDVRTLSTALDQVDARSRGAPEPDVREGRLDPNALDEVGRTDTRQAVGQPQQDARNDTRHLWRQDGLDDESRRLPDRCRASR